MIPLRSLGRVATVLVTAGLTGCIGSQDPTLDPANATDAPPADVATKASPPAFPNGPPAPTTLEFRDCYQHLGILPGPASANEDRIPEGFSLTSYQDEPTGTPARLTVLGLDCEHPEGTSVTRAWTVPEVDPPNVWKDPNVTDWCSLLPSLLTDSEHVADVNGAWGFGPVAAAGGELRCGPHLPHMPDRRQPRARFVASVADPALNRGDLD